MTGRSNLKKTTSHKKEVAPSHTITTEIMGISQKKKKTNTKAKIAKSKDNTEPNTTTIVPKNLNKTKPSQGPITKPTSKKGEKSPKLPTTNPTKTTQIVKSNVASKEKPTKKPQRRRASKAKATIKSLNNPPSKKAPNPKEDNHNIPKTIPRQADSKHEVPKTTPQKENVQDLKVSTSKEITVYKQPLGNQKRPRWMTRLSPSLLLLPIALITITTIALRSKPNHIQNNGTKLEQNIEHYPYEPSQQIMLPNTISSDNLLQTIKATIIQSVNNPIQSKKIIDSIEQKIATRQSLKYTESFFTDPVNKSKTPQESKSKPEQSDQTDQEQATRNVAIVKLPSSPP